MPMYDFRCVTCGAEWEALVKVGEQPNCRCGQPSEKIWRGRTANVIPDSFIGGQMIENLGPQPVYVESRSQLRAEAAARGLMPLVQHRPSPGSDKNREGHTSRWV